MWSLEKLKEWARPALRYKKLIEIARTAPSAKQAKNQALKFTKSRKLDEEVAKTCRWLMIIRRDYGPEVQKEYISSAREGLTRKNQKLKQRKQEMKKQSVLGGKKRQEFVFDKEFDPQKICKFLGKEWIDSSYRDLSDSRAIGLLGVIKGTPVTVGIAFYPDIGKQRSVLCKIYLNNTEIAKIEIEGVRKVWWERWLPSTIDSKVVVFEKASGAQLAVLVTNKSLKLFPKRLKEIKEICVDYYDSKWWGYIVG